MKNETETSRFVLVRCGEQRVLIPAPAVVRVLGTVTVTPIPGAAPEVLGLTEVEGEPLAVLDLARIVGDVSHFGASIPSIVEVRTTAGEEVLGLAVDEALRLVDVVSGNVSDPPSGVPASGVVVLEDEPALVLDVDRLAGEEG